MRACVLLLCLFHWHLIQHGTDGKRFDPSMVDPLMRRSPLDRNFMRYGRSSPAYMEEDEMEDRRDTSPDVETSKEENFLRSMRGKEQNFLRYGRGKQDKFIRFGRDNERNYMRFGRGRQDNFMRLGRGRQDYFMRLGRGRQDNLMRFGRGKQDNLMRFGRNIDNHFHHFYEDDGGIDTGLSRESRGRQDSFMRLGKRVSENPDSIIPIAMRSVNPKSKSNIIRFGRSRQDSFTHFGKPDAAQSTEDSEESSNNSKDSADYQASFNTIFKKGGKSKDINLIRFGRHPKSRDDSFIRYGRNSQGQPEEEFPNTELIPQRLKRSIPNFFDELYPVKLQDGQEEQTNIPYSSFPDDSENGYLSPHEEDDSSRKKRSLMYYTTSTSSPMNEERSSLDYVHTEIPQHIKDYLKALDAGGIGDVNLGFAPEFALLPNLDPPSSMLKKNRPGDQNFLRLG